MLLFFFGIQGLLVLLLYGILRNPCLRSCGPCKKKFTSDHRDAGSLPPVSNSYNNMIYSGQAYPHDGSVKGSQASLINEVNFKLYKFIVFLAVLSDFHDCKKKIHDYFNPYKYISMLELSMNFGCAFLMNTLNASCIAV